MKCFDRAKHIDHKTLQYSAHYWVTIKRYVHILWAIPWTIPIFTAAIFYCDTKKYNSKPHPPTALLAIHWDLKCHVGAPFPLKEFNAAEHPITSSWFSYRLTHALINEKMDSEGRDRKKDEQKITKIEKDVFIFFNVTNVEVVITQCLESMIGELSLEAVGRLC